MAARAARRRGRRCRRTRRALAEVPALNRLEAALRGAATALSGRRWALVGGLAISTRCEPRFTRDVDLAVAVASDTEAEGIVHSLLTGGYSVLATVEHQARQRLATARLGAPGEGPAGVVVDLLFASSGIEPELVDGADLLEVVPGFSVPVAKTGDLIALKLLSRDDACRPQDAADLVALRAVAAESDIVRARSSVRLIEARGFNRGRRLEIDLDAFLARRA